jgi:phage shock protein PspC (stress-responsive transcriptional regulator)
MTDADALTPETNAEPRARRWRRSASDRYLAGVAAGIARLLDVDVLLVRIALVVGAVFSPVVLIGYALVWLLVPMEDAPHSLLRSIRQPPAFREAVGAVGLIVGAAIVLPDVGPGGSSNLRLGVLLIACGALLLVRPQFRPRPDAPADDMMTSVDAEPATGRWRAPRAARPRSSLSLLTVSCLVLAVGVAAAVDHSGRTVSLGVVSSVALVVVGGVLTLSAWRGRARGLILLAPALVAAWTAFAPGNIVLYPGSGARVHTIRSATDVDESYRLGFGSLTLDAGAARLDPRGHVDLVARTTAGRVRVDVPADARLRVVGRVGLGAVDVYDEREGWSHATFSSRVVNGRLDRRWAALEPFCDRVEPPSARPGAPPVFMDRAGRPCIPEPLPHDPPEVTVRVTLGTGYLEVHRVAPPR